MQKRMAEEMNRGCTFYYTTRNFLLLYICLQACKGIAFKSPFGDLIVGARKQDNERNLMQMKQKYRLWVYAMLCRAALSCAGWFSWIFENFNHV